MSASALPRRSRESCWTPSPPRRGRELATSWARRVYARMCSPLPFARGAPLVGALGVVGQGAEDVLELVEAAGDRGVGVEHGLADLAGALDTLQLVGLVARPDGSVPPALVLVAELGITLMGVVGLETGGASRAACCWAAGSSGSETGWRLVRQPAFREGAGL